MRVRHRARTLADVLGDLGDIPAGRVCIDPPPGRATEADVIRLAENEGRLCELVDGTLVEKAMGWEETKLEGLIFGFLHDYLKEHPLGEVYPGTGFIRLAEGVVRGPDVTVCLWNHVTTPMQDRKNPIARTVADLAVEVVSRSNTAKEMARKCKEYFDSGTTIVWLVYPKTRTIEVYISPTRFHTLGIDDTLDGGMLLPGLRLPLRTLFARPTKGSRRKKK
ncbi:MAG TPA: Uma2 family endonuclease [Gemmataceae bacterium]|nr:Uma2 family endonuclease [Gemmataceae bacterium]